MTILLSQKHSSFQRHSYGLINHLENRPSLLPIACNSTTGDQTDNNPKSRRAKTSSLSHVSVHMSISPSDSLADTEISRVCTYVRKSIFGDASHEIVSGNSVARKNDDEGK